MLYSLNFPDSVFLYLAVVVVVFFLSFFLCVFHVALAAISLQNSSYTRKQWNIGGGGNKSSEDESKLFQVHYTFQSKDILVQYLKEEEGVGSHEITWANLFQVTKLLFQVHTFQLTHNSIFNATSYRSTFKTILLKMNLIQDFWSTSYTIHCIVTLFQKPLLLLLLLLNRSKKPLNHSQVLMPFLFQHYYHLFIYYLFSSSFVYPQWTDLLMWLSPTKQENGSSLWWEKFHSWINRPKTTTAQSSVAWN